jgi:hypothetical protein
VADLGVLLPTELDDDAKRAADALLSGAPGAPAALPAEPTVAR